MKNVLNKNQYMILLIIFTFFFSTLLFSEENNNEQNKNYLNVDPGFTLWGARLLLEYNFFDLIIPNTYTVVDAGFGGSYEDMHYFRYPDGSLYAPPNNDSEIDISLYKRINYVWVFGMKQGFLVNPENNKNFLELLLLYKGNYDNYLPVESPANSLIFESLSTDDTVVLQNSIMLGILVNNLVVRDKYYTVKGYAGHIVYEIAPAFLGNNIYGDSDFSRLQLSGIGAVELLKTDTISIYMADRIIADFLFGNKIPINMQTSIGAPNLDISQSLGESVRGIEDSRFDGNIKILNNFDIRFLFPSLFKSYVIPGFILFMDTGISDEEYNIIDINNLKWTCGTGLYLQAEIAGRPIGFLLRFHYFLNENKFSGDFSIGFDFIDY